MPGKRVSARKRVQINALRAETRRRVLLVGVTTEGSMEDVIFELDLEMRWKRDRANKGIEMATASSPIWDHGKVYGRQKSEF